DRRHGRGWRGRLLPPKARRRGGPSPLAAAATRFGREGYRSTPVTGLARDAQAGRTAAYACFPGREAVFRTAAEAEASGVIREELAAAAAPRWRPGPIRYSSPARLTRYSARTAGPLGHTSQSASATACPRWSMGFIDLVRSVLFGWTPASCGPLSCSGCWARPGGGPRRAVAALPVAARAGTGHGLGGHG